MLSLLIGVAAFAAAVVLVPLGLLLVATLLVDERPERFLSDPGARRPALLRG